MDTSAKKFNSKILIRILCIVLSAITLFFSVWMIALSAISMDYFGERVSSDFTSSYRFESSLISDMDEIARTEYDNYRCQQAQIAIDNQKTDVINKATRIFLEMYNTYKKYNQDIDEVREKKIVVPIKNDVLPISFKAYYEDIENVIDENADYDSADYESVAYSEKSVKSAVEMLYSDMYGEYAYDTIYSEDGELYPYDDIAVLGLNNFNYLFKYDDYTNTNISGLTKETVYTKDIYFAVENGKVKSKGIDSTTVKNISDEISEYDVFKENIKLYVFLDIPEKSENLIDYFENYDKYQALKEINSTVLKYRENLNSYIFAICFLLAVFLVCVIYLIADAIRRKDKKLSFIDYIPLDIQLALGVVLSCGAIAVSDNMYNYGRSYPFVAVLTSCVLLIWLLGLSFAMSVVRSVKSDRKLRKFFFIYWFIKSVGIVLKYIYKKIRNLFRKTIGYKPENYKRRLPIWIALYLFINFLIFVLGLTGEEIGCVFAAFLLVLFNIGCAAAVFVYIKKLDRIITDIHLGDAVSYKDGELPRSLKTLADSYNDYNGKLTVAVNKAVKDERLRTELITNVSHDLKTPLTSIITYADLLSQCDIADEKAREYIDVLNSKGNRLKRLIDDLIEASKVTSGNVTINPTILNLSELCLQSTVDIQSDFDKRNLELVVNIGDVPVTAYADGVKTFRVLENLFSNAKKYSSSGSRVYVDVYKEMREKEYSVIEIKNVSAKPLNISVDELTERFVRGDKSRSEEGNGLGLSIAKELCLIQGGNLEISIDGDLFKVKVVLPCKKVNDF